MMNLTKMASLERDQRELEVLRMHAIAHHQANLLKRYYEFTQHARGRRDRKRGRRERERERGGERKARKRRDSDVVEKEQEDKRVR